MFDVELHQFSVFIKFMQKVLPRGDSDRVDLEDKLLSEYYRLRKEFEGSIELSGTNEGFPPISGEAGGRDRKKDTLQQLIDRINERYGPTSPRWTRSSSRKRTTSPAMRHG